jgi:hypothetical protein
MLGAAAGALRRARGRLAGLGEAPGLIGEFLDGGLTLESAGLASTLQLDGDLQLRLGEAFRAQPEAARQAALARHFEALDRRLQPMRDMAGAVRLLRWGLAGIGLGVSGAAELLRPADTAQTALVLLAPHLPGLVLLAAGLFARRLVWAALRRLAPGGG